MSDNTESTSNTADAMSGSDALDAIGDAFARASEAESGPPPEATTETESDDGEPSGATTDATEEDGDGGETDEQESSEPEEDKGDEAKETKEAKSWRQTEREKIARNLEPKIREQVTKEIREQVTKAEQETAQAYAERDEVRKELSLNDAAMETAMERMDLYERALKGAGLWDHVQPHLDAITERGKRRTLEVTSDAARQVATAEQHMASIQARSQQTAYIAELKGMAKGRGVDPERFLFEMAFSLRKGDGRTPEQVLAGLVAPPPPARAMRARRSDGKEPPPSVLAGGGNAGGAPTLKLSLDDDGTAWAAALEAEADVQGRSS